jgi:hypothetical protein
LDSIIRNKQIYWTLTFALPGNPLPFRPNQELLGFDQGLTLLQGSKEVQAIALAFPDRIGKDSIENSDYNKT